MNVYPEIKNIAGKNDAISRLAATLEEKIDCDGLFLKDAYFVSGCKEKNGHLYKNGNQMDNGGLVDDDYYCDQHTGYCEDDYHGTLYFKTNVPGQFVAVPFSC